MPKPSFPDEIEFRGLNMPIRTESSVRNLAVEGVIPADIRGAFFRSVPDPAHPPMNAGHTLLSADGMVAKFLFTEGPDGTTAVDHDLRYVHTARYVAEQKARRSLFGRYRNPFTDDPAAAGVDRTVANTTPVFHGGYLLATKEDGRPYRMNPHTLETYGSWDYAGKLKSETMTAHVRVDPVTGEMFSFGYEATGLCSKTMSYFIVDKDGQLQSEQFFDAPYCGMVHDMGLTERHVVFPVFPTTADLGRLKAGGPHWVHEQNTPCWVGIMPRYGKVEAMRWFPGPPGSSAYHLMNCFDEGDMVHMDFCWSDTNGFPFIREDSGIHKSMQDIQGGLLRWSFNLADPAPNLAVRGLGPPGDLPRIADADHGRPYSRGWYITVDPQAGPPIPAGPVNAACNLLLRVEPHTGRIDALPLGAGWAFNEPQHVPAKDPAHGGWLLTVVDQQVGEDDFKHALWVLEADAIGKGPIAKVALPFRLRQQVHGWWVPQAALDAAK